MTCMLYVHTHCIVGITGGVLITVDEVHRKLWILIWWMSYMYKCRRLTKIKMAVSSKSAKLNFAMPNFHTIQRSYIAIIQSVLYT